MTAFALKQRPRWMQDEHVALMEMALEFFEKECAPNEERWGRQQHPDRKAWTDAGALGLLCPSIPEEYGGGGGTFAHDTVVMDALVRALSPSMAGTAVHSTIVAHYLNAYGSEE